MSGGFTDKFFPGSAQKRGRFAETASRDSHRPLTAHLPPKAMSPSCRALETAQQAVGLGELIGTADVDDLETGRADPHDFM